MQALQQKLEIAFQLEAQSCLYFSGYSEELQLPLRTTALTSIDCGEFVAIVPYIPGREILRLAPEELNIEIPDLLPPCSLLKRIIDARGFIELEDLVDLRFVSYTDRVTGRIVKCYIGVVKPGVVFEGRILVDPCNVAPRRLIEFVESLDGAVLGGLRLLGCGHVRLKRVEFRVCKGGECKNISRDEAVKLGEACS